MIELIKEEPCAIEKGHFVKFPNSETAWGSS